MPELPEPPPLDEWLKGREILTVKQDGSAMFTTIQAALDAIQPGQVVEILDAGPYREFLKARGKSGTGIISKSGAVIRVETWEADRNSAEGATVGLIMSEAAGIRLSGLTFECIVPDGARNRTLHFFDVPDICIENCSFHTRFTGRGPEYPLAPITIFPAVQQQGTATIRDCDFHDIRISFGIPLHKMNVSIERCLLVQTGFGEHAVSINCSPGETTATSVVLRHNVIQSKSNRHAIAITVPNVDQAAGQVLVEHNTIHVSENAPGALAVLRNIPAKIVWRENLMLGQSSLLLHSGAVDQRDAAIKQWTIVGNAYSLQPNEGHGVPIPAENIRFDSSSVITDLSSSNCFQIPASAVGSLTLKNGNEGTAVPGALNPLPERDDWFEKLRQRWSQTTSRIEPDKSEAASLVPGLPEPPPLDEWLEGRTAVTVALDGSGDYRSVVEALEAVKQGQYVRILDKGPYRERLEFGGRLIEADTGLVGDRAVIELPEWTPGTNENIGHSLRSTGAIRFSGVEFLIPKVPDSDRPKQARGVAVFNVREALVEDCGFVFPEAVRLEGRVSSQHESLKMVSDGPALDFTPQLFVRNCVFRNGMVIVDQYKRPERPRVSVRRCWFLSGNSVPLRLTVSSLSESFVVENVFDPAADTWLGLMGAPSDPETGDRLVFARNTVLRGFLNISGASVKSGILRDNLYSRAAAHDGDVEFVRQAEDTWQIGGNGIFTSFEDARPQYLRPSSRDVVHAADFLSTNPVDRNYARIPESSPFARAGRPESGFSGALPPGPAPAEGDWFTKLRDRWGSAIPPQD